MIETVMLIILAGKIGNIAQEKGHSRIGYGLLTALLWFAGEIGLGLVAFHIGFDFLSAIPFCIVGAAIGAVISYLIVSHLPETQYNKTTYASRYSGNSPLSPQPEKKPQVDERTDEEREDDNFAHSVGLSALAEDDE